MLHGTNILRRHHLASRPFIPLLLLLYSTFPLPNALAGTKESKWIGSPAFDIGTSPTTIFKRRALSH